MPAYAVTGAGGHLGHLVVEDLLARGVPSADIGGSIARGDLEPSSDDLTRLLGRPSTPLAEAVRAAAMDGAWS
jgi:hypothetical protein